MTEAERKIGVEALKEAARDRRDIAERFKRGGHGNAGLVTEHRLASRALFAAARALSKCEVKEEKR